VRLSFAAAPFASTLGPPKHWIETAVERVPATVRVISAPARRVAAVEAMLCTPTPASVRSIGVGVSTASRNVAASLRVFASTRIAQ
jgi:hypothetical protein